MKDKSAEDRLAGFLAKYTPDIAELARTALAQVRALLPGAVEMVYDNYNALVIGFGPTERASHAIISIVLYPRWVSLCFLFGASLPDPQRLLKGDGQQVRHVRLEDETTLDRPGVRTLIVSALARAPDPWDGSNPGRLVIKSVSAKQRPRRPTK
jgi:hypothetical protein